MSGAKSINTKLLINIFVPVVAILVILLIMSLSISARNRAERKNVMTLSLVSEISELNQRTYYYLFYGEDRAKREWFLIYESLLRITGGIADEKPEEIAIVGRIKQSLGEMKTLFAERLTPPRPEMDPGLFSERQARLSGQLLVRARAVSLDAQRLYELTVNERRQLRSRTNTAILLILLSWLLVTLATLVPINRRLSRSVSTLTAGAGIIGSGNLDHRIAVASDDEIGLLSQAFNQMTANLKAITVSRDEMAREIAERKRVEDALARSETILAQAGQMAHLGAWELEFTGARDINENPLRWSDEVYRIFGYEPGSVAVTNDFFFDRVHPDDRELIRQAVAEALAARSSYSVEHRIIRPGGEVRTVLEHGEITFEQDGKPLRISGAVQDITERKQNELNLELSKQEQERYAAQLETIFNNLPSGLVVADLEGKLFRWNPAAVAMHGFAGEEEGRRLLPELAGTFELSVEKDGLLAVDGWPLSRILRGETLHDWEVQVLRKDTGWRRVFSYGGTLARDREGRPLLAVIIVNDITERKQRDREFRKISRQNELILESAGEGIFGLDLDGRVTFVNAVAAYMLGYGREELRGSHSHTTWHFKKPDGSDYPSRECPIYAAYHEGAVRSGEETFWRKDGTAFPIEFTSRPLYEDGMITGAVVVYRDITERKRAEEDLRALLAELERSNRELEQFAYVASHDLQEPLRMVASYVQLFERKYKGHLDAQAEKYIFFAVDGVKRMQKLIEGLLAYSRVARGAKFGPVNMNVVFKLALANLSAAVAESKAVVTSDDLPPVLGDETQLTQVFQNLLGNALKFRAAGTAPRVHVSADRRGKELTFSVSDNGIGIGREYTDRIFLIFQRLHSREEYPGTGIGLSLCKRIVERHGGRIWVESAPGKGATFYFTIPKRGVS